MTLVLTEISPFGIAMAADSAVTITRNDITRVLTGVRKLQVIEKLGAGISVWGVGEIEKRDSDVWLSQFIRNRQSEYDSIESFATFLRDEINRVVPPIDVEKHPEGTIGFHLAGFVTFNGTKIPTFYHVHNGRSGAREEKDDPSFVNVTHYLPPEEAQPFLEKGGRLVFHNGDYQIYRKVFDALDSFFKELETINKGRFRLPYSICLADREEWLRFQIATISALYDFAGLETPEGPTKLPTIGGPITSLRISGQHGIESYVTRSQ